MKAFTLILVLSFSSTIFAHHGFAAMPQDSAKFKLINGNKFLLHKVQPQETWNSIARKYNLPVNDLMKANTGVTDLKIAQVLNIPAVSPLSTANAQKKEEAAQPTRVDSKYKTAVLYTVQANETLFSIAKKFNSTVEDVKKWNNLSTDVVHEGQNLIVSYNYTYQKPSKDEDKKAASSNPQKAIEIKSPPFENKKLNENSAVKKDSAHYASSEKLAVNKSSDPSDPKKEIKTESVSNADINDHPTRSMIPVGKGGPGKTVMQVTESGVCSWINDVTVNQNKFYGLHRTAAIGTIMKVTNKMNERYVFVKIVGLLPDTGDNENDIIKISQAAVNKIGALDAHFQVELSYGVVQ